MHHPSHDDPGQLRVPLGPGGSGHSSHHYNPNQPRVPAGRHEGGQWTGGDTGSPRNARPAAVDRRRLAAATEQPQAAASRYDFGRDDPIVQPAPSLDPRALASEAIEHWIGNTHSPQALAAGLLDPRAIAALLAGYAAKYAARKTIEAALALITWASTRSTPDQQPVLSFKAYPYERDEAGGWRVDVAGVATQEQLKEICGGGIKTIQFETDKAFNNLKPVANSITRSKFGIDVHKAVKAGVDKEGNRNLQTEQAITKQGEGYAPENTKLNKKDSIRVDVLEKNGEQTICVHDIKTGRGLTKERIDEILKKISSAFPNATHIVITEVRPTGAPRGSWRTLKGP